MQEIETMQKGNKTLKIFQDSDPESPRDWDNFGKMVLTHKRYDLPNELNIDFNNFNSWDEVKQHLIKEHDAKIILMVKGYDHSGLSISVSEDYPFNDYWDSGVLGFIIAKKEDILREYKNLSKKTLNKIEENLKQEVETYNQYLKGEVYGFNLVTYKKCKCCGHSEEIIKNSCWGFFGDEGIKQIKQETGFI